MRAVLLIPHPSQVSLVDAVLSMEAAETSFPIELTAGGGLTMNRVSKAAGVNPGEITVSVVIPHTLERARRGVLKETLRALFEDKSFPLSTLQVGGEAGCLMFMAAMVVLLPLLCPMLRAACSDSRPGSCLSTSPPPQLVVVFASQGNSKAKEGFDVDAYIKQLSTVAEKGHIASIHFVLAEVDQRVDELRNWLVGT